MKRLALFGATVLFPCGLLVVFGSIMVRQDRELAARHGEDQRRAERLQQHQDRSAQLERIKRAAAAEFFAGRKPLVDFAAVVVDSGIPAPWEATAAPWPVLETCERAEFAPGRLTEAIACYYRALGQAKEPQQKSDLRLRLGRALSRAGHGEQATRVDRELLQAPFTLADDQGVPFAYYAADRLLRTPAEAAAASARFQREPADAGPQSPAAAYLLKSIAEGLNDRRFKDQAETAIQFANQVESLRADLPGLLPLLRRDEPEPVWLEHGPWQIGLAKAPESGKELVVGVATARLPTEASAPIARPPAPRTGIYAVALSLVLLIAAFGAYLLWRDVQRDVAMADMRSQFVSSVSHELQTPLTAIRMFAETLRMRPAAGGVDRDEYLDTIVNESERLSRLVDNVLDFSKIEQGRKLYELQPTSTAAILDAVVRAVRYPLQQSGFVLRVTAEERLPDMSADADAIQQALLNLIMNAMKYSAERKEIELAARQEHGAVVIAVRDYGIGIPAEYRQRIFERFYRVPSPENQRVPGTGLGLTLVAHIARAHGGDVKVESTPGAGSLFELRLPVEQPA